MRCEYCEQELIWMHDEDFGDEEIVSIYWCSKCDVMFEMLVGDDEQIKKTKKNKKNK